MILFEIAKQPVALLGCHAQSSADLRLDRRGKLIASTRIEVDVLRRNGVQRAAGPEKNLRSVDTNHAFDCDPIAVAQDERVGLDR